MPLDDHPTTDFSSLVKEEQEKWNRRVQENEAEITRRLAAGEYCVYGVLPEPNLARDLLIISRSRRAMKQGKVSWRTAVAARNYNDRWRLLQPQPAWQPAPYTLLTPAETVAILLAADPPDPDSGLSVLWDANPRNPS